MKTQQSHQKSKRIVQKHRFEARHPHMLPLTRPRLVSTHSKRTRRLRDGLQEKRRESFLPLTNYCRTINKKTNKFIYFLASSPVVLGASSFVFLTWLISLPVVHCFIFNCGEYFHFHGGQFLTVSTPSELPVKSCSVHALE